MSYNIIETEQYCYKTTAIEILGLSYGQFTKLGLKPVKYEKNPNWHCGWVHLYDRPYINSLVDDPRVIAMRTRRKGESK